jgi:arginine deiminase
MNQHGRHGQQAQPGQPGPDRHLDTVCTVLGPGVVLMTPALAFTLTALTIAVRAGKLVVSRPRPLLEAAARALGLDRLTVIETGAESLSRPGGQWDDGANALVIGDRTVVCEERNVETNARMTAAGFEVVIVPYGELGRIRGGPRSMCAPMCRELAASPAAGETDRG